MKKIFGLIFHGICWSIFALSVVILLGHLIGIRPFITMSGSMEPAVPTGSLCFVNTKADFDRMEEGDIIAFRASEDVIVTHRVISVTEDGLKTKGDANRTADPSYVTEEHFYGETFFSIPWLGYGIYGLQQPVCLAVGIVLAAAVGLWEWIDRKYIDSGTDGPEKQKGRQK